MKIIASLNKKKKIDLITLNIMHGIMVHMVKKYFISYLMVQSISY